MSVELVTRKQLAEYFGVTSETIKNWGKKGLIKPHCAINGRPRYSMKDVIASITEKKGGTICS